MIVYAQFELSIHGLEVKTHADMDALILQIQRLVEQSIPNGGMSSDVEVELIETAGKFEE